MVAGLWRHISHDPQHWTFFRLFGWSQHTVRLCNEQECVIAWTGEVPIQMSNGNSITLYRVHHVPMLKRSLVSNNMLAEAGYWTTLSESSWLINRGNMKIEWTCKYNNLYPLMVIDPEGTTNVIESQDSNLWHG